LDRDSLSATEFNHFERRGARDRPEPGTHARPFYFEELRGFSVEKSGLLLTPLPLTIAVVAPLSGTLADRIGSRWLASGGLALGCLGLFLLAAQVDSYFAGARMRTLWITRPHGDSVER
jgi:MFS family permease